MNAPPILLVHGAWHGPWCWDDFAERLGSRGHDVHTVMLSGHDGRRGRIRKRLGDYVEDVRRAVTRLGVPPLIVGHSLGGLAVQKYLEDHRPQGAVLLASIPSRGTAPAVARLFTRHPLVISKATVTWSMSPFVATAALVRELFFRSETPDSVVSSCRARLQDESYRVFLETLFARPRTRHVEVPILVLGAESDGFFSVDEVRRTARDYGTEAEIFPAIGHDMMLDRGWGDVADRIDAWARQLASADPVSRRAPRAARPAS